MKVVEIILLVFLMACSLSVFLCRNLLVSAILFMANSLIMSIIWVILQSPDLAITEAAVGAGVTGILLFITLYKVDGLRAVYGIYGGTCPACVRQYLPGGRTDCLSGRHGSPSHDGIPSSCLWVRGQSGQ